MRAEFSLNYCRAAAAADDDKNLETPAWERQMVNASASVSEISRLADLCASLAGARARGDRNVANLKWQNGNKLDDI